MVEAPREARPGLIQSGLMAAGATTTPHPDATRRAGLLMSRYVALTEANPGFHYHLHMRAWEAGAVDTDSVTSALVGGDERAGNLQRMVSDEQTFQIWRLRLEHPRWWIGGRANALPGLLAQLISELEGDPPFGMHTGLAGYPGAHWFSQAKEAIKALSGPARLELAPALHRELLGRELCMSAIGVSAADIDISKMFPEWEFDAAFDGAGGLERAVEAAEVVHGSEWAEAFRTMIGELDPIIWPALAGSLEAEVRTVRSRDEGAT